MLAILSPLDTASCMEQLFSLTADVCEAGNRELAAQALISMDSPNGATESRTFLQSVVPNGNTSASHSTHGTPQSKTGMYAKGVLAILLTAFGLNS